MSDTDVPILASCTIFNFSWGGGSNFEESPAADPARSDPFSGEGRYTGLEFCEDPFKNSNYRYGDPFDLENANEDPFSEPFEAPKSEAPDAYGRSGYAFGGKTDPFSDASAADPFKSEEAPQSDPFASAFGPDSSYENSSRIDPFSKSESSSSSDPFGPSKPSFDTSGSDPFGNSFASSFNAAVPNVDPFGSNNNFSSGGHDPFSLTNLRPPPQVPANNTDMNANKAERERVAPTTSTVSYRKAVASVDSSEPSTSKVGLKKKTSHSLSDFLTGSPLKAGEKSEKTKEKKEKKHGKFHISSPLKGHKSKSGESPKSSLKSSTNDNGVDEVSVLSLRRHDFERLHIVILNRGIGHVFMARFVLPGSVSMSASPLQLAQLAHEAVDVVRVLCSPPTGTNIQSRNILKED